MINTAFKRWLHKHRYQRFYFVHIRKSGGTSLNNMFLSLSGRDPAQLYQEIASTPNHRVECNGKVFIGWNVSLISQGDFFYAFSHNAMHELDLPRGTFTLTCFRDPVKRVVSHYKMLMEFVTQNIPHPCMAEEGPWLGKTFADFIHRMPKDHLLRQLYMFSAQFNEEEAVRKVKKLSYHFFTEDFAAGIAELNRQTGLQLEPIHIRKAKYQEEIPAKYLNELKEMLEPEYSFLRRLGKDYCA